MADLTDEQCDAFRRLPGSFNDMVRAIYRAGRESTATPPADAALADRIAPSLVVHYGQVQHENEKLREEIAALRARAVPDDVVRDAERFRWLVEDHDDAETRRVCRNLTQYLCTRSLSGNRIDIDEAMLAASKAAEGK